jgi:hypothetical protein
MRVFVEHFAFFGVSFDLELMMCKISFLSFVLSLFCLVRTKNKSVSSQRPKCEMSGGVVLFVFEFYMSNENTSPRCWTFCVFGAFDLELMMCKISLLSFSFLFSVCLCFSSFFIFAGCGLGQGSARSSD